MEFILAVLFTLIVILVVILLEIACYIYAVKEENNRMGHFSPFEASGRWGIMLETHLFLIAKIGITVLAFISITGTIMLIFNFFLSL